MRFTTWGILLVLAASLAGGSQAVAAFKLKLELGAVDSAPTTTAEIDLVTGAITGSATYGSFNNYSSGGVNFADISNLQIGNYTINLNSNSNNVPGTQNAGTLGINGINVVRSSDAASTAQLRITLSATDYNLPVPQKVLDSAFTLQYAATSSNAAGRTVEMFGAYDSSNTLYGPGDQVSHLFNHSTGAQSENEARNISGNGPYSITNIIVIRNLGVGGTQRIQNADIQTTVIAPAPSGLILALTALPLLAVAAYFRRRSQSAYAAI